MVRSERERERGGGDQGACEGKRWMIGTDEKEFEFDYRLHAFRVLCLFVRGHACMLTAKNAMS